MRKKPVSVPRAPIRSHASHGTTPRAVDVPPPGPQTPDSGQFGRIFPNLAPFAIGDVQELVSLGMKGGPMDAGSDIPPSELSTTIPAGFTYFGQFLDHNITFDANSNIQTINNPYQTSNFRSGRVDLEHVYGLGPSTEAFAYYDRNEEGKFWLNPATPWDVPRNEQGTPVIADPRNDNTVITVQLHVALMRFHNAVVDWVSKNSPLPSADLFNSAWQIAVWHYQWIVVHEWLRLILMPDVWADIMARGPRFYTWTDRPYIPVEFNTAAYRLHPLVKQTYALNDSKSGTLFHFRPPFSPLPEDETIDWSYFFDFGDGKVQYAKRFEAKIVDTFLDLPGGIDNPVDWEDFKLPDNDVLRSIAVRNLLRSIAFQLPSGESVAQAIGAQHVLSLEELGLPAAFTSSPLWYYVMREADVQTGGVTLGEVGSRIVGEVFYGLIWGDASSYLREPPQPWTPFLGATPGEFTMVDLLRFGGSHP